MQNSAAISLQEHIARRWQRFKKYSAILLPVSQAEIMGMEGLWTKQYYEQLMGLRSDIDLEVTHR